MTILGKILFPNPSWIVTLCHRHSQTQLWKKGYHGFNVQLLTVPWCLVLLSFTASLKYEIVLKRGKNRNHLNVVDENCFRKVLQTNCFLTRESSCQFHQHFTSSFFIQKLFEQLFCTYILGLYFLGTRKLALKLLVKCWWNWPLEWMLLRVFNLFWCWNLFFRKKNFLQSNECLPLRDEVFRKHNPFFLRTKYKNFVR